MTELNLDFQDTATAFADRTDRELKEKYRMFRLMNSPVLNGLGTGMAKFALSLGLPVEGLIKNTVYEQFCGGETIEECQPVIERLGRSGIGTILDYSVEGKTTEAEFDSTKDEIIRTIKRARNDDRIPFAVFKMSGIAPLGTLEKMSAKKALDAKGQTKCEHIHSRVEAICSFAAEIGQPIFIDAEESWIQDAIDRLATEMMERFNRGRAIVYNTIQLYRKDRLQFLRESRRRASKDGYILGVKLVRGAYMEKERQRAEEMGYPSPIHDDKAATDADYDSAIEYCLKHLDEVSFVAGTHNEASTRMLAERVLAEGMIPDHPHIYFSQLYGMSDNLSYVLAKHGFNVSKYLPYGPVRDALPYLIRRAEENTSVAGQVSRELDLIAKELKRRKLS
ncbi:proline dehydrogenase family protein [Leptolyngbya sp. 7M]|uniref:proline dehydrogenase family protein n=1 Tax=Leptolyngbya sp. 7M TaxID=2812896 RepID=UPI001B8C580A|nr:proline dehydrogenase family protein [Leptolyngbya sp. 7M]QYO65646.1 proline dehydrogenase family protein [Leptolyngbya sp. 7M]